jgi:hypothetical protein
MKPNIVVDSNSTVIIKKRNVRDMLSCSFFDFVPALIKFALAFNSVLTFLLFVREFFFAFLLFARLSFCFLTLPARLHGFKHALLTCKLTLLTRFYSSKLVRFADGLQARL